MNWGQKCAIYFAHLSSNLLSDTLPAKEGRTMFEKKIRICLNSEEIRILTRSLIDLRNDLIQQGRYTDAVDEILLKLLKKA